MSSSRDEASGLKPWAAGQTSRSERVDALSLQLMDLSLVDETGSAGDVDFDLGHVLTADAPAEVAVGLYRLILSRRPDSGSLAAQALSDGLSPVRMAMSLLESPEGQDQPAERRALLELQLTRCSLRESWGLPITGSLLPYVIDPNLPFILAGYRIGLSRPPQARELTAGRHLLGSGLGRERFLRQIWQQPGTPSRVCGRRLSRTARGRVAVMLRPRQFSTFRAHVLAMETALAAQLASWELAPDSGLLESGRDEEEVVSSWYLLARINEVAAGVRRLVGDRGQ